MTKRRKELSFASVVLMLLVIFIHVASEFILNYRRDTFAFAAVLSLHRLSSFAVQGFIFLSGLKLFLRTNGFSYGKFYIGRLKRVVLPYLIVFSVFYIYFWLTGSLTPSFTGFIGEFFGGGLVNHFYFVIIICQFYILMPLWRLIFRKANPLIALIVSLILMFIFRIYLPEMIKVTTGYEFAYNARIFTTYLFYFIAGMFAAKYYDGFIAFLTVRKHELYVTFAVTGVIDCFAIWCIETKTAWLSWADMFHVLYCITAILALMALSVAVTSGCEGKTKALSLLDKASYNVYLIHPLVLFILEALFAKAGLHSLSLRFVIRFFATYVLSVGLCVLFEMLKNKLGRKD